MIGMEVGKGPRSLLPAVLVFLVSSLPTGVTAGDKGAGVFIQLETGILLQSGSIYCNHLIVFVHVRVHKCNHYM